MHLPSSYYHVIAESMDGELNDPDRFSVLIDEAIFFDVARLGAERKRKHLRARLDEVRTTTIQRDDALRPQVHRALSLKGPHPLTERQQEDQQAIRGDEEPQTFGEQSARS